MSEVNNKRCSNCNHFHRPRMGYNSQPFCDCGRETAYKGKHNGTRYVKGDMGGCLKWEVKESERMRI